MKSFTTLIVALLLTTGSLQAEQIFVLFDGTCGDRVQYEQAVAAQPRMNYFAYHFSFQGGDRLMLETGAEGATVQNYLPQGYIYCGDPRLNLELANRVNGGVDQVFILLPTANNQYIIQPIVMASTLQRRGANFTYSSPLSGYQFDTENGIIGENLAYNNDGAKVYFEGRENSPCTGIYLFRQLKPGASYPVIDFKIAPELGVYERRLGSDGISTSGGVISVRQVNGIPVNTYLASVCASETAQANTPAPTPQPYYGQGQQGPQPYSNQQPQPQQPYYGNDPQPESQAYAQAYPTTPVPTQTITHTVSKGETLFAVSRKYGTTVDAVKAQNGLTGNTVFPGQQLAIKTPVTAANNAVALNPTVPTIPYNAGPVANSNPGAAQPTPYGTSPAAPVAYGSSAQTPRSGQTAVYGEDIHIVQPGETVASLALKYGFTSAKFREMNELGPNDIAQVGAQLKTSDCNCPAPVPVTPSAEPAAYGNQPPATQGYGQPAAVPQSYGQPAVATPQAYGQATTPAPTPQAYRTPEGYQAPQTAPVPAMTTPQAPAQMTITNNPNFGQFVPNAAAPPSATMGQLEGRGTAAPDVSNPATYNARPAPATAPAAAPNTYQYNSPQPVPNAYGTPVGATAPPATQQPAANRAFHLVQEGESLFSISRRYGLTTDQLRTLNNLDAGGVIVPFQKLYVN
ncbi:LysM peptidoglycan-binding domain-containing protein [Neolewinella persica]|uniref:LysM peptidoglycan-binding domain-containing protein n=1 Tax=Neolewinella persica TaxID=70998 RepID=UPI00037B8E23|nr:LysM peptidoglycan-binding domain-containing protein [Neolewinella persica]